MASQLESLTFDIFYLVFENVVPRDVYNSIELASATFPLSISSSSLNKLVKRSKKKYRDESLFWLLVCKRDMVGESYSFLDSDWNFKEKSLPKGEMVFDESKELEKILQDCKQCKSTHYKVKFYDFKSDKSLLSVNSNREWMRDNYFVRFSKKKILVQFAIKYRRNDKSIALVSYLLEMNIDSEKVSLTWVVARLEIFMNSPHSKYEAEFLKSENISFDMKNKRNRDPSSFPLMQQTPCISEEIQIFPEKSHFTPFPEVPKEEKNETEKMPKCKKPPRCFAAHLGGKKREKYN